jgi:hypothetical protein
MLDLARERRSDLEAWIKRKGVQAVDKLGEPLRSGAFNLNVTEARRVILPALISSGIDVGEPPNDSMVHLVPVFTNSLGNAS